MNKILLENIGKKYDRQVIFSDLNLSVQTGDKLSIVGYNGSGKSTLLQTIAGFISPNTGQAKQLVKDEIIPNEDKYKFISFAAPYLELFEEFSLQETVVFYSKFKKLLPEIDPLLIPEMAQLSKAGEKQIKYFSSGMKQRLKLILAFLTDVPFLFLDEPVSNLDKPGINWYKDMVQNYSKDKIVLISSNEVKDEIDFCNQVLRIEDYKK